MQIFNITAVTFAAMATASPVDTGTANPPSPILPSTMPPYEWPMPPSESPMPPSGPSPMPPSLIPSPLVPPFHFEAACSISELALCASELIGSTAKCNAEIMQNGLNFAANLACFISAVASGVASSIDMCKHCIPKTIVVEPQTVEE
ncbi:hypothetical protein E4U35_006713 [Claviceps purpurea]|nr:hypothetical protein E4U38_002845 [Claviceps purpurea]KAG6160016.1 hypothetical protein E4U11_004106 [Claviceps purpurea]KAG6173936.1 hypothetical protein E4U27_006612 [Claviceps purpurea]KAG6199337.1 hypothetical protein E4U35_006713 [Claviceps purpurea]KAG6213664.1 hypothetical protein E4U34_006545 [Claviceps purpurea]